MISRKGRIKSTMSDNIFNRVGSDLSETAITGMLDEEIKGHKKEEAALPIIKLALPVVGVHGKGKGTGRRGEKEKDVGEPVRLSAERRTPGLNGGQEESVIKLPDSLTTSQKLRKMWRFRRFGMQVRETHFKTAGNAACRC